jgi:hypothetical protein
LLWVGRGQRRRRKESKIKGHLFSGTGISASALLVLVGSAVIAVLAPSLASGAGSDPTQAAFTRTIYILGGRDNLRFLGPKTVVAGEELRVENLTNPRQVGPQTFSLVTPESLPNTARARRLCFAEGHICKAIAGWHGARGTGPPSEDLVQAGAEGWDTPGSVTQKGDSWFSDKQGEAITQQVSANTSGGPVTLYFICALYPWVQGSITVLPPGS